MALDLVDAAASTVSAELAMKRTSELAEGMNLKTARDVAAVLAVEAVWVMPPAAVEPPSAEVIHGRQQQLREWSWKRRRDASKRIAQIARLLWEQS